MLKRTPKSKGAAPARNGSSAKKQKSILSFFQTASRATPTPNRTPPSGSQPASDKPAQKTPSTAASLERTSSPAPSPKTNVPAREKRDDLRRKLFAERKDDEPPVRPTKRRRLIRLDDFTDDDTDDDKPIARTAPKRKSSPEKNDGSTAVEMYARSSASNGMTKGTPSLSQSAPPSKQGAGEDEGMTEVRDEKEADASYEPDEGLQEDAEEKGKDIPSGGDSFNFSAMQCGDRNTGSGSSTALVSSPGRVSKARMNARKKLGALDADRKAVGSEERGWCEKHPWTVDIHDEKGRRPSDPDYDKTTLYVPPRELTAPQRGTKGALSPFQRQFWSIKKKNYDTIIFFKKGKFYELYDVDADIGHQQLGLNFTKGGRVDMRCCGVPEQSFDKHSARLIDLGYKVGRVEQTETANAAEKRKNSGGNKSSVCERSLVRILTKATVTDEGLLRDHRARYVMAITESAAEAKQCDSDQSTSVEGEATGHDGRRLRKFGVCYVDVASGSISVGEYDDDFRLAKTERLMTFLHPQEIIVDLSRTSPRLSNIVKWTSNRGDAEIIDTGRRKGFSKMTDTWLAKYLPSQSSSSEKANEYIRVRKHLERHPLSGIAFGFMASHLKSLIIDQETLSLGNYVLFPEKENGSEGTLDDGKVSRELPLPCAARLSMDAPTLENLEVLTSSVDDSERGALISFVDRAMTPAGRRLIRRWLAEPLVSAADIEDRLQAIEDIHALEDEEGGRLLGNVTKQLKTKKDLERALPKLHQQATVNNLAVMFDDTNKRRVKDFVLVIRSLHKCLKGLQSLCEAMISCTPKSRRLKWLCTLGGGVPVDAEEKLDFFLGEAFDMRSAEEAGEILPKPGAVPLYDARRKALNDVEEQLNLELEKWQQRLGDRSIKFYHRGKEPYQIEVRLGTLGGRTPSEFEVCSESKNVKRFYTRQVKRLVRLQVEASEAYEEASSSVARDMMLQFDKEYSTWSAISTASAEIDALIGLAYASRENGSGPMCRPTILPNDHPDAVFEAEGLRHPILACKSESFVSNDVKLGGGKDPEIMVLTGPNAGGKSTLARQIALGVILAQLGCYVPAKSFRIRPFEHIFVRMGASDDLARGRSTFMVEMEEVGNILNNANSKSLIIADEVGRGTSTHDGYAVAYASLDHISKVNKSITVFSTHYSHLGEDIVALGKKDGRVSAGLYEMGAVINETSKQITFLYKLQRGSGGDSRGIYCARVAGIPESIAQNAELASAKFDKTLETRLEATKFCGVVKGLDANEDQAALALMQR